MRIFQLPLTDKLIGCALLLTFVAFAQAQTDPPSARVGNVTDEYFGVRVTDPYRWMEDLNSDEMQKWMRVQADYADAYLQKLPMRGEIFRRLKEVSGAGATVTNPRQRGNRFFISRREANEENFKLYVREGLNGGDKLLIDPNKVKADGKRYSIGARGYSMDGKYVSYFLLPGGAGVGELRVVEVDTGRDLGIGIGPLGQGDTHWLPDGKSFLYNRPPKLPANVADSQKNQGRQVFLYTVGAKPEEQERAVFGVNLIPGIKIDPTHRVEVIVKPDWKYALAVVSVAAASKEYYFATLSAVHQTPVPWRKIVSFDDEVFDAEIHGDDLYLRTSKNTPRFKIVRMSLKNPDVKRAETVFAGGEAVVNYFETARDALYVEVLDGGTYRIHRVDYKTGKAAPLKIPYEGSAGISGAVSGGDGIFYSNESWTKPRAHFKYDPKTQKSIGTNLIPPAPVDLSGIEFTDAKAKSHDGVLIPLVIIYKNGLKRDGKNPVLMSGYGAYGVEWTSPVFNPLQPYLPWLERGGVLVFTGVRGGGEYGEEWHMAGFQKTKPNTWKDFIACAEYLIQEKYTAPEHLGITGASAGGILISNAIAERPDLFAAAIIEVGLNNPLRAETTRNGPVNAPEFGTVKTEEGFRALLGMDGYLKVKDGVRYPAVLLVHGANDSNVVPWMSAKMAARLQAASVSGKPVLLRLDYDAGHGGGTTADQTSERLADEYAFLFQQLRARE